MDDRNKDLPLIVSEILIEMHEMKEDIREMKDALNRVATVVLKQQEHMNSVFDVLLDENKKNIKFMTSMVADVRKENISLISQVRRENNSLIQEVRQETVSLINEVRQEAQEDRRFSTYSLNKAMGQQQQVNAAFEQRLIDLEAKYNG